MKIKEYMELYKNYQEVAYQYREADFNNTDNETMCKLKNEKEKLYKQLEELKNCTVSFNIGSRSYYEKVTKIGNSYFDHGRRMTKGRGYWNITEIAEITDSMKQDMLDDSYYY